MNLLLVEDEEAKERHIAAFVSRLLPHANLRIAHSVRSAMDSLLKEIPDLLILDMSLPTFDIGPNESGGRPQGFGGLELMRNMELEEIRCPTIVLTGYEAFTKSGGQVTLDALSAELAREHPEVFKGIFHFNSAYGDWQDRVRAVFVGLGMLTQ
jgi:CheY-like chemotaxis protein